MSELQPGGYRRLSRLGPGEEAASSITIRGTIETREDTTNSEPSDIGERELALMLVAFTCRALSSGVGMAQDKVEKAEKAFENFDRSKFDRSTNIDNQRFPLKPGTQLVYFPGKERANPRFRG